MATVQVTRVTRETVIEPIKRMPDDKLAVLYDFGRYIMRPVIDEAPAQDVSAARGWPPQSRHCKRTQPADASRVG